MPRECRSVWCLTRRCVYSARPRYHPAFRLFLTTSIANPHFTPETCSNATVLNFMLTPYGLEEQLLTTVISREIPALEDRKVQLAIARAGMEAELLAAEDKILSLLNTTTEGHLLDDTDLILALARAKGACPRGVSTRRVAVAAGMLTL